MKFPCCLTGEVQTGPEAGFTGLNLVSDSFNQ